MFFKRRLLSFLLIYTALSLTAAHVAPHFGRIPLSCLDRGALQVQSPLYCALNRTYVTPDMAEVLKDTAARMTQASPGTITLVLDANFPFGEFPMFPHLSHTDGIKADLALYYADETGYLPGVQRSPIGYFAFENGPTDCPEKWDDLRWDLQALQPLWRDLHLDTQRTKRLLTVLSTDPRVGKVFLEPHLKSRLGLGAPKIRFQGCRAARHDDHIHIQL